MKWAATILGLCLATGSTLFGINKSQNYELSLQVRVAGCLTEELEAFLEGFNAKENETEAETIARVAQLMPQLASVLDDSIQETEFNINCKFQSPDKDDEIAAE